MKRFSAAIVLLFLALPLYAEDIVIQRGTRVHLATADEGRGLAARDDAWIRALSPFDRKVMLQQDEDASTEEILAFMSDQVCEFTEAETTRMREVVIGVRDKFAASGLTVPFPPVVTLVKTTGREQGDSAYCRGSVIAVPQSMVDMPPQVLTDIIIHELFHVMSNGNPSLRAPLYAIIGFKQCTDIELPASLENRRITNPDEYRTYFYTDVHCKGSLTHVVIVPLASRAFSAERGGDFTDYLTVRFMPIEEREGRWSPVLVDGQPQLLKSPDCPDLKEVIGDNTGYILGPEEIMAENFRLLIDGAAMVRTPRILKELRELLSRPCCAPSPMQVESSAPDVLEPRASPQADGSIETP